MAMTGQHKVQVPLLAAVFFLGCTQFNGPEEANKRTSRGDLDASTERVTVNEQDELTDLSDGLNATHKFFLLDAEGLKARYLPVFGSDMPRGYPLTYSVGGVGYGNVLPYDRGKYFFEAEQRALGTVNLRINAFRDEDVYAEQGTWLTDIGQDYIRILRLFLGDACKVRVGIEVDALVASGSAGSNRIVKRLAAPTKSEINAFMNLIFGYEATDGSYHFGADEYEKVFATSLAQRLQVANVAANSAAYNDLLKAEYGLLCIAIGQDQRVYLR